MNTLPKARTENIVEQNLKQETLIYDLVTNQAFNLNETLSIIYKACDGMTTFADLKRKYKFSDGFIFLALDELKQNDLLAKDALYHSPFARTSRREAIKKVGLASMFVLPLISGLVAPQAINAASGSNNSAGLRHLGESCVSPNVCDGIAYFSQLDLDRGVECVNGICCLYGSTRPPGDSQTESGFESGACPESGTVTYSQYEQNCCTGYGTTTKEYSDIQELEFDGLCFYAVTTTTTCSDSF